MIFLIRGSMILSFLQDWWLEIVVFVQSIDRLAFIAIIALLSIGILLPARFIIKNSFNVNAYKKNLTLPILLIILFVGLIVMLTVAYL